MMYVMNAENLANAIFDLVESWKSKDQQVFERLFNTLDRFANGYNIQDMAVMLNELAHYNAVLNPASEPSELFVFSVEDTKDFAFQLGQLVSGLLTGWEDE